MKKDLVSIIITTYRGNETLDRAIKSVIKQDYCDYEIIVVDDNDEDSIYRAKTKKIMEKYISNKNIKYVTHPQNMNGACARNTGIKNSKGIYISFLDDDDEYTFDRLSKLTSIIERTNVEAVFSGVVAKKNDKNLRIVKVEFGKDGFFNTFINPNIIGTGSNIFIKREACIAMGGFDEKLVRNQDYDFLLDFFNRGYKAAVTNEILVIKHDDIRKSIPKYTDYYYIKDYIGNKYNKRIINYSARDRKIIDTSVHHSLLENAIYNKDISGVNKEIKCLHYKITFKEAVKIIVMRHKFLGFITKAYYWMMSQINGVKW
jgi:glycosyltransferase involved in cell wall biosynthesis|nr:glycosyltransferase family 2 protein [Butyrivibrio sp.]